MKKKVVKSLSKKTPVKKHIPQTQDQFTVVLEHIHSDFKMFGESLQFTNNHIVKIEERLDAMDARFDAMDARFDRVDTRLESIEARLAEHDTRIKQLELAIVELIKELRDDTKQKEIEALKVRVSTLEALLLKK